MAPNEPSGSRWRKWDLHVHTPASIVGNFHDWEAYLGDLEGLPTEFAVLGINDYLFLDGYRQILRERERGRLRNIATVLPVIELRLNAFGGTESSLRRVNLHVLFSEELEPDQIESQFLNALAPKYRLSPQYDRGVEWNGVITRDSLQELGRKIKESVPAEHSADYGSDLQEGFSNLTVTLQEVLEILGRPTFRNKARIGVGKTEWAAIKWNAQSIADKKNIINAADLVFVASASPSEWLSAREALVAAGVNGRLLDCSDAHNHSGEPNKDRIGNCFTWINADPTFEGLCHAIHEYDHRVFIGELPHKLKAVARNPGQYIDRIEIRKRPNSELEGGWFDLDLALNPGFVAVVGNRGKGKSALVDVLGLVGSSPTQESFSFLSRQKFRHPRGNKAREFDGTLSWCSGEKVSRNLDETIGADEVTRVRYLPQSLLESLCNEDPTDADSRFEQELGDVIFSHVPTSERLGCRTLDSLLNKRAAPLQHRLDILQAELSGINSELISVESASTSEKLTHLRNELRIKQGELEQLMAAKPPEVPAPEPTAAGDPALGEHLAKLAEAEKEKADVEEGLRQAKTRAAEAALREAAAARVLKEVENLGHQFESFSSNVQSDLDVLGIQLDAIATLTIDERPVAAIRDEAAKEKAEAQRETSEDQDGSLEQRRGTLTGLIQDLAAALDEPKRKHQEYLHDLEDWENQRQHVIGDETSPGSITGIERAVADHESLPTLLADLKERRLDKVRDIHGQLMELVSIHRDAYQPVQTFIRNHPLAAERFDLEFDASLSTFGLADRLLEDMLNRAMMGSFYGVEEAHQLLAEMMRTCDSNDTDSVLEFVTALDDALHKDVRPERGGSTSPEAQLRRGATLQDVYNLIFGLDYLRPRFLLKSKGKPIARLSPGEKGTLLLMFYFLVDMDNCPIVVDQPEENLDSQTVHDLLVPAIKDACKRRQVTLVTHSPNLAVVGDADQVICADFDDDFFRYESGSIENPAINTRILDILEGTGQAFTDRGEKYQELRPWRRHL